MEKTSILTIALLLSLGSAECKPEPRGGSLPRVAPQAQNNSNLTSLREQILGQWIHSREEDLGNVRVYRRPDYAFPPSRGRDGFTFRMNGEFEDQPIGRGDASDSQRGSWKVVDEKTIEIAMAASQSKRLMRVVNITSNKLELNETAAESEKN